MAYQYYCKYYYYYYYAAFNAPCVGHKDDESQAQSKYFFANKYIYICIFIFIFMLYIYTLCSRNVHLYIFNNSVKN